MYRFILGVYILWLLSLWGGIIREELRIKWFKLSSAIRSYFFPDFVVFGVIDLEDVCLVKYFVYKGVKVDFEIIYVSLVDK